MTAIVLHCASLCFCTKSSAGFTLVEQNNGERQWSGRVPLATQTFSWRPHAGTRLRQMLAADQYIFLISYRLPHRGSHRYIHIYIYGIRSVHNTHGAYLLPVVPKYIPQICQLRERHCTTLYDDGTSYIYIYTCTRTHQHRLTARLAQWSRLKKCGWQVLTLEQVGIAKITSCYLLPGGIQGLVGFHIHMYHVYV